MVYVTTTPRREHIAGTRPKPYLVTGIWGITKKLSRRVGVVPVSKLLLSSRVFQPQTTLALQGTKGDKTGNCKSYKKYFI